MGCGNVVSKPELPECKKEQATAEQQPFGHVSWYAVSLNWLAEFLEECPEIQRDRLTTAQVVEQIIKPATAESRSRYVDLTKVSPAIAHGQEFHFVSHAWGLEFVHLVEMLQRFFSPAEQLARSDGHSEQVLQAAEVFVWLDVFAINQHPGAEQQSDLEELKKVVADAQQTLMVLDSTGLVLSRIWCLYEAWQTSRKPNGKLHMISYGLSFKPLEKAFLELDVAQAQASKAGDLESILADIKRDIGFMAMNQELKSALVASVLAEVPPEGREWSQETEFKLSKAAKLCELYGRLPKAESLYRRALVGMEGASPNGSGTFVALNNLAGVLTAEGQYEEAELLYRRILTASEKLGPEHSDGHQQPTLTAINNFAALLDSQHKYSEAEPLYRSALASLTQTLGPLHPDTLSTSNNLAGLLHADGRFEESEALFRQAFAGMQQVLGELDPNTISSCNNLAGLLGTMGQYDEAERLYRQALAACEQVLGVEHPNTLAALANLATLLKARHKLVEAEEMLRRALAGRTKVLGPAHPETIASLGWLVDILSLQGRKGEALTIQQQLEKAGAIAAKQ